MNFLSSLWNGIKSTASSAYNYVSNGLNSLSTSIANSLQKNSPNLYTASVANAGLDPNKTVNYTPAGQAYQTQPSGAVTYGANLNTTPSYSNTPATSSNPTVSKQYSSAAGPQAPQPLIQTTTAPMAGGAGYVDYAGASTRSLGSPYFTASGEYVVPSQAFSGTGGSSSNSFSFAPQQNLAQQGAAGTSAFTGTLGATSGLSTPAFAGEQPMSDEEKRRKGQQTNGLSSQPIGPTFVPPASKSFGVDMPTGQMNVGDLATAQKTNAGVLSTNVANSVNDRAQLNSDMTNQFNTNLKNRDTQTPLPANPIQNSPEQDAFLKQLAQSGQDPYGVQQAMDEYKAQNTQLSALTAQRVGVMKNVQAINDTYTNAISQIKANPNLPKGLATRRLQEINTQSKTNLQGLLNQLEILNQSIDDQNNAVNRAFNIVTNAQGQQDKAQDNARQMLQIMVSSHAIGGFNDSDMQQFSKALGIPVSAIAKMRDAANSPELDISTVGNADTGYYVVSTDKKTGKVVSKTAITNSGGSGQNTNAVYSEITGKPLSDAERTARGYADRASNATSVISDLGSKFTGVVSYLGQSLPNAAKSEDRQKFEQAQRDFINAVLRRESGAVISEEEFANARQQYFPQPGDTAAVIKQKESNRNQTINNLELSGGINTAAQNAGVVTSGVTSSGIKYTITK